MMDVEFDYNLKPNICNMVFFVLVLLSLVTTILIVFDNERPEYYELLPLVPFCYGITIILCQLVNVNAISSWYILFPMGMYGIRNVVTPLFMRCGSYYGAFVMLNDSNVNEAIALIIVETFVVLMFVSMKAKGWEILKPQEFVYKSRSSIVTYVMTLMVSFCLLVYFLYPEISNAYVSIFGESGIRSALYSPKELSVGTGSRSIFTLFQVLFPMVRIFVAVFLIVKVNQIFYQSEYLRAILVILLVATPTFFMNGGDGNTIIEVVSLALVALFVSENSRKLIIGILAMGIIVLIFSVFDAVMTSTFAYSKISAWQHLSGIFQAYFPGMCNMAGVFNTGEYDKISEIFYDFYSTIPFRNTIFGLTGFISLPNLYTIDNYALSHIMPCVGHMYYYVGYLAIIVPCLFYSFGYSVYQKMVSTSDPYVFVSYVMLFLYLELTPVMYNAVIFGAHFFIQLLPSLLLAKHTLQNTEEFLTGD